MSVSYKLMLCIEGLLKVGFTMIGLVGVIILAIAVWWFIDLHASKKHEIERMELREEWKKREHNRK